MKKVIVLLAVLVLISSSAVATVVGTPHDLSGGGGAEICVFCHTPHHGDTAAPLWNRSIVVPTLFYSSDTFNGGTASSGGASICLSCHVSGLGVQANIGTDLRDDHPVGFSYATSVANDVEIKPIGTASVQALLNGGTTVGCYTCHDVHNNGNGEFLKMSNADSAMCKACHLK